MTTFHSSWGFHNLLPYMDHDSQLAHVDSGFWLVVLPAGAHVAGLWLPRLAPKWDWICEGRLVCLVQGCVNDSFWNNPVCSMYGIFAYIWIMYWVNVGQYSIQGAYGSFWNMEGPHIWRCQAQSRQPGMATIRIEKNGSRFLSVQNQPQQRRHQW